MTEIVNPFTPSFGESPPSLMGRDFVLTKFASAMNARTRHPGAVLLLRGRRGTGKTVLLQAARDEARLRGWGTLSLSASGQGGLTQRLVALAGESSRWPPEWDGGGIGFNAELAQSPSHHAGGSLWVEDALMAVSTAAGTADAGVLILVDEIHAAEEADARTLANAIQMVRGEGKPLMFVGAGLPSMDETILGDEGITFFQRCEISDIGPLSDEDAASAVAEPITRSGWWIDDNALGRAVGAASGYPYMIQLIGFHTCDQAENVRVGISSQDVEAGIAVSSQRMGDSLLRPMWVHTHAADQEFLLAMSYDSGDCAMSTVRLRLDISRGQAHKRRDRLVRDGWVAITPSGGVRFAHTAMAQWVEAKRQQMRFEAEREPNVQEDESKGLEARIVAALSADPAASYAAIAEQVKTSSTWVSKMAKKHGLARDGRKTRYLP